MFPEATVGSNWEIDRVVSHTWTNEGSLFALTNEARLLGRWFVSIESEKSLILDI